MEAIARSLTRTRAPDGREVRMQPQAVDVPGAVRELGFPPKYGQHTAAVLAEAGLFGSAMHKPQGTGHHCRIRGTLGQHRKPLKEETQ
jgi:hypothetical protein